MTEALLFQAVIDAPDDDAPRLAWADHLRRTGDAVWADLISVQVESARLEYGSPEWTALRASECELLAAMGTSGRPPAIDKRLAWGPLRRGFVDELVVEEVPPLVEHSAALSRAAPTTCLNFSREGLSVDDFQRLLEIDLLRRIKTLRLWCCFFEEPHLEVWASADRLSGVERLDLSENDLSPSQAGGWLNRGRLGLLQDLDLSHNPLRASGVEALVGCPALQQLERLCLNDCLIAAAGAAQLGAGEWRRTLTALDVSENRIREAGAAGLAACEWPLLKELRLSGNDLRDPSLRLLSNASGFNALVHLDLSYNRLSDDGLAALPRSSFAGNLRRLDLRANRITDRGATVLSVAFAESGLLRLDLRDNPIRAAGKAKLQEAFGSRVLL